jgi:fluoride ion exporter CrcB/FEX
MSTDTCNAIGAAIGAPLRFVIDQYLRKFSNAPWGTFTVNIIGSFVIGLTWGASENTGGALLQLVSLERLQPGQHLCSIYTLHLN